MTDEADNPFQGQLSDERTARLWSHIAQRLDNARKPEKVRGARGALRPVIALGFAALFAGAAVLWAHLPRESAPLATLATEHDSLSFTLDEGSKLAVEPHSQVRVLASSDEQVQLELERGAILCDVVHKQNRRFAVLAGDFEVRVVGTRFVVEREVTAEGSTVKVRVERGGVEVRRVGQEDRLFRVKAGQSWSSQERLLAEGQIEASRAALKVDEPGAARSPVEVSAAAAETGGTETKDPLNPLTSKRSLGPESKLDAFEQASAARRSGRAREAIQLYERFITASPQDERRGLAAFEVARLEMDALSDPKRALLGLERAQRLSGGRFREDILARLVQVHNKLGQIEACQRARDTYLAAYTKGVHRVEVEALCP